MLLIIAFWFAIALSFVSWIGAIVEHRPSLMTGSLVFLGLAVAAGVANGLP